MNFQALNADQLRLLSDAGNQYEQWLQATRMERQYSGWMTWRDKSGVEYLTQGESGGVNQKSLGARSPETEAMFEAFTAGKDRAKFLRKEITSRLGERAPLLKAARLGRVLAPLAKVVREFDVQGLLGSSFLVGGTHAIAVYEALSGHFMQSDLMATEDLDFIWKATNGVELLVKTPDSAILAVMKSIDDTYTVNTERTFQVRNSKGLVIDFISDHKNAAVAPKGRLKPVGLDGQDWLLSAPIVDAVCIDTQGTPVRIFAPDPRMFALHKMWVSMRKDRNQLKSPKDRLQSVAIIELIVRCLPQFPFDDAFKASLPGELSKLYEMHVAPTLNLKDAPGIDM